MTNPPPTYTEAREARRIVNMAKLDPFRITEVDLRKAQDVLRRRGDYLSACHKASPKYRAPDVSKALKASRETPVEYARIEARQLVAYLRTVGTEASRAALREIGTACGIVPSGLDGF